MSQGSRHSLELFGQRNDSSGVRASAPRCACRRACSVVGEFDSGVNEGLPNVSPGHRRWWRWRRASSASIGYSGWCTPNQSTDGCAGLAGHPGSAPWVGMALVQPSHAGRSLAAASLSEPRPCSGDHTPRSPPGGLLPALSLRQGDLLQMSAWERPLAISLFWQGQACERVWAWSLVVSTVCGSPHKGSPSIDERGRARVSHRRVPAPGEIHQWKFEEVCLPFGRRVPGAEFRLVRKREPPLSAFGVRLCSARLCGSNPRYGLALECVNFASK
jgi:hypothetical protein